MSRFTLGYALAVAVVGLCATAATVRADAPDQSVSTILGSDPRFSTTMKMIYMSGASGRLNTMDKLTVFAATDAGWDSSPYEGLLSSLSSNGATSEFPQGVQITEVLRGFFVHGDYSPERISGKEVSLKSAAGREIDFDAKTMTVKWTDAEGQTRSAHVVGQPIVATNGVVYPVDAVVGE